MAARSAGRVALAVSLCAGLGIAGAAWRYYIRAARPPSFFVELAAGEARYELRQGGYAVTLQPTAVTMTATGGTTGTVTMRWAGGRAAPTVVGERSSGRTPSGAATFEQVRYRAVYPGIDLVLREDGGRLDCDFVVAAGADPSVIHLTFAGADVLELDRAGDLLLHVGPQVPRLRRPRACQRAGTGCRDIAARFRMTADGSLRFLVAAYDRSQPLVIGQSLWLDRARAGHW